MKNYTATLSFADAQKGYAPGQTYELTEEAAAGYVALGWLVPVEVEPPKPAKRTRKTKAETATADPAVETAAE